MERVHVVIGKAEGPEYQGLHSKNSWTAAVGMSGVPSPHIQIPRREHLIGQIEAKDNDFIVSLTKTLFSGRGILHPAKLWSYYLKKRERILDRQNQMTTM